MSLRRTLYLLLALAMAGVYVAMVVWTLPAISEAADGMRPFDLRPGGYSFAQAEAFLNALSAEGRALYLGPQRLLDLVYPALLGAFLIWSIRAQAAAIATPVAKVLQIIGIVCAAIGMVFDYLENHAVAAMLGRVGSLDAELVSTASTYTVAKSLMTTVAMVFLLGLLVWRLQRRLSAR